MRRDRWVRGGMVALLGTAAVLLVLTASNVEARRPQVVYTSEFPIDDCAELVTSTDEGASNAYVILEVGRVLELNNQACVDEGECDELEEVLITVLDETEMVNGVVTRVVEEREWTEGELEEVSRNFFVECLGTGDVYYFGEDVEDGEGEPLPDGWRAGDGDNRPGLIFPGGAFLVGARYFQEVAPDIALDRAEHAAMGLDVEVPAGNWSDCVLVMDTNALEDPKGKRPDPKVYCPGVGQVVDEDLVLVDLVEP